MTFFMEFLPGGVSTCRVDPPDANASCRAEGAEKQRGSVLLNNNSHHIWQKPDWMIFSKYLNFSIF